MSVLFVLVALSVIVAGTFLYLFILSVRKGQFDDDYTPSVRMLFDDATTPPQPSPQGRK
ncbi:MAG: cbb3-type cytochrome oxidase assembly protein CcoS [Chitinophagaceae bacterium]|nr:MAG: cbb3-type cytochrome oxidase assembly protein CcoS [Chitinophagaceae bacterium]